MQAVLVDFVYQPVDWCLDKIAVSPWIQSQTWIQTSFHDLQFYILVILTSFTKFDVALFDNHACFILRLKWEQK